jgi:predicted transcriptional regulator
MNSIKNSQKFKDLVKELARRLYQKKLSEITTTASIDTYQTPYAFSKKGMKKKRKKDIEKQTGYKFVDEAISKDDMKQIRKEIRKEVSDILFDIWVKRSSWGGK